MFKDIVEAHTALVNCYAGDARAVSERDLNAMKLDASRHFFNLFWILADMHTSVCQHERAMRKRKAEQQIPDGART